MPNFIISCPDNDSSMCGSTDKLSVAGVPACQTCGFKTDLYYINPEFVVKRRVYDLSSTYDGYDVASLKFVEACLRLKIHGASFIALPSDPAFFVVKPEAITAFDAERRKTRFEGYCSACNTYRAVAGATPAFLAAEPTSDLSGTDIVFGSGNARSRLLVSTERAKDLLAREALRGLHFGVVAPNNSFNPTAGVGLAINKQPGPAAG